MSLERWKRGITAVRSRWTDLERDWRSVVVGATIVALAGTVRIPW
ncbi:hypothetical protein [Natronococcus wangiae]|nr:hypothetical protein [Natronococcus sp. AD5]